MANENSAHIKYNNTQKHNTEYYKYIFYNYIMGLRENIDFREHFEGNEVTNMATINSALAD